MRLLLLKRWRDMRAHWGQFAALILLVTIGITTCVAFVGGYATSPSRPTSEVPPIRRIFRLDLAEATNVME